VRARYDSIRGPIAVSWKREKGHFDLTVTVPANTTAKVVLPTDDSAAITESGKPLSQTHDVTLLDTKDGGALLSVGSGTYRFRSPL
jgi:alpha-L-rhamnosidase